MRNTATRRIKAVLLTCALVAMSSVAWALPARAAATYNVYIACNAGQADPFPDNPFTPVVGDTIRVYTQQQGAVLVTSLNGGTAVESNDTNFTAAGSGVQTFSFTFDPVKSDPAYAAECPGTGTLSFTLAADTIAPIITGSDSVSVPAPSTTVATYTANEAVTWSVTGGANAALFQIDSSGVLSFVGPSVVGVYSVIITASDAADTPNTSTKTVTVTVTEGGAKNFGQSDKDASPGSRDRESVSGTSPAGKKK
jgi:hypothetical protein